MVGLYFEGKAQLLSPGEEQAVAAECINKRFQPSNDILEEAVSENGHQIYKITVTNWHAFGRFGNNSGQKLSLEWNS